MPEPIDQIPDIAPATTPDDPAAAALIALIQVLYTDPLAAPLTDGPGFFLHRDDLSIRYSNRAMGVRQLEAARALFGGAVTEEDSHSSHTIAQKLTAEWQGFPLSVYVQIAREDELAELRKRLEQYEGTEAVARAALESSASAYGPADAIVGGLDAAGLLQCPERAEELTRLRKERQALNDVLAGADEERGLLVARITELLAVVLPSHVYRAEHESIPLGTYWTRDAARSHIIALIDAEGVPGIRGWVPDHGGEDAPEELCLFGPGEDDETCTGYAVVPVPVATAYDPEAEG